MVESVLELAASPWALLALLVFCTIDGFFPPVPSESVVIALASLSVAGDGHSLWLIVPVAALGAFLGDTIAYLIGTRLPVRRMRIFRSGRGQAFLAWAEHALQQRGGTFILSARYIPIGRVAVNMTAGAVGFGFRRFVGYAAIAAVMWSVYSTILGVSAGAILHDHPVLAVVVGVVFGVLMGTLIDSVMRRVLGAPTGVSAPDAGGAGATPDVADGAAEADASPVDQTT